MGVLSRHHGDGAMPQRGLDCSVEPRPTAAQPVGHGSTLQNAAAEALFGDTITIYTALCEQAREKTWRSRVKHARRLGANATIGMRYDATDVMTGLTEVLCYGTAVVVEPLR
ncbi:TPA: heavy metal-binding domain-containing protein [Stenotrophomonas maltophilia]|nr:heavy metal-binding domain-containing protein [Stenotrophomonas maltophilia]